MHPAGRAGHGVGGHLLLLLTACGGELGDVVGGEFFDTSGRTWMAFRVAVIVAALVREVHDARGEHRDGGAAGRGGR